MPETYECAMCKGTFEKAWSDEEAEAEMVALFGSIDVGDCEVLCDDCFHEVGL